MLLLLNRITLADRGMVAPGHLVDEVFENTSPYLDAGAIFVPDTIDERQWRTLVDTSVKMRLRGEDWVPSKNIWLDVQPRWCAV
jgi:hypothetical protein